LGGFIMERHDPSLIRRYCVHGSYGEMVEDITDAE